MPETFTLRSTIPALPKAVYDAWLDGKKHGDMTGGDATCEARVGGQFTAWDEYIEGTTLELTPGRRIVQSWRTFEFPPNAPESRLEILLEPVGGSTRLTLIHSNIPEGQAAAYKKGWEDHYFAPMQEYFARFAQNDRAKPKTQKPLRKRAAAKPAAKPARKRKAK